MGVHNLSEETDKYNGYKTTCSTEEWKRELAVGAESKKVLPKSRDSVSMAAVTPLPSSEVESSG